MATKKILTLLCITLVGLAFTGCSDDEAAPTTVTIDTAPPAVPANLDVEFAEGAATLSWDQNTVDNDLAGYVVVRERYGVSETLVGTPELFYSYVDAAPLSGSSIYHVYSVDTSGNESAVASSYLTVELGHQSGELQN